MNNPNRMSKNSNTLPSKSILKHLQPQHPPKKGATTECSLPTNGGHAHFDEMNIIQTFHPENKDYGHMKIAEPDTPYNKYVEPETEDDTEPVIPKVKRGSINYSEVTAIDPVQLSKHLLAKKVAPLKSSVLVDDVANDEETEKEKAFKAQRAAHYGKEFVKRRDLPSDDK